MIALISFNQHMKYKIEFNYRYGKDYVYCNHEDERFIQPLNSNGKPLCTIAKTNILSIRECK